MLSLSFMPCYNDVSKGISSFIHLRKDLLSLFVKAADQKVIAHVLRVMSEQIRYEKEVHAQDHKRRTFFLRDQALQIRAVETKKTVS